MRRLISRMLSIDCTHNQTIVVRSGGLTRVVCEACGLLSFYFDPALTATSDAEPPVEARVPAEV